MTFHRLSKNRVLLTRLLFLGIIFALLPGCNPYARLEGEPTVQDSFVPLPYQAIIAEHSQLFRMEDRMVLRLNRFAEERPYRTQVLTTGVAQSLAPMHSDLIQIWSRYMSIPVDFSRQYTQEVEFSQGESRFWVAIRPKEHLEQLGYLKEPWTGEARFMLIGAVRGSSGWEPIFLLNRFTPQKKASE